MADIVLTFDDGIFPLILQSFGEQNGYQQNIPNPNFDSEDPESLEIIPNPEDPKAFAIRLGTNYFKQNARASEMARAVNNARRQRESELDQLGLGDSSVGSFKK